MNKGRSTEQTTIASVRNDGNGNENTAPKNASDPTIYSAWYLFPETNFTNMDCLVKLWLHLLNFCRELLMAVLVVEVVVILAASSANLLNFWRAKWKDFCQ